MLGLYPQYMVERYVCEQCQITSGTWSKHLAAGRFKRATTRGPGAKTCYYTEAEVVEVLNYWRIWWRHGRDDGGRDRTRDPFDGIGQ